jgi:bifunctional ADP-heptose synthase (sugar kinase/adenylyltransferase)
VVDELMKGIGELRSKVDAVIVLDQVDVPETGVVTSRLLPLLATIPQGAPGVPVIADSRRGLRGYPPVIFKMNAIELAAIIGLDGAPSDSDVKRAAAELAERNQREVFVTMAERGLLGAAPGGKAEHVPALALRGPIDVVGAGDAVTANLCAALAAGANLREALELAAMASSIVIHQLGTTGTASLQQIEELLCQH